MIKSNYYWLLDAGHGGIDSNGVYTTAPSKMFTYPDGLTIYEGVINREITKRVYTELNKLEIDFGLVYDDVIDTSLEKRVEIADKVFAKDNRCIYVSIHSNSGGGEGFEIFTSVGQNKSDIIAQVFCNTYIKHFPGMKFRKDVTDNDYDKESNFYVLRKTDCPALLIENLFFDNRVEAEFLLSSEGQQKIADCIVDAIKKCELIKPI